MSNELTLRFQPSTLQHLGVKMYNHAPAAIAELIANAYDADATTVEVILCDKNDKKIIVKDNGIGMSFDDLNNKFLKIGRNRREEDTSTKTAGGKTTLGRLPSGKKGLGKLALFGLGNTITVKTKSKNSSTQSFSMNWKDIKDESGEYHPTLKTDCEQLDEQGTQITVSDLKRKSNFDQDEIANGIARLFNYFDNDFIVTISVNNGDPTYIDNKKKYETIKDIQFEWNNLPEFKDTIPYITEKSITGKILTTKHPLKSGMRGIALFANGRLVNMPEFFGHSESSHFYSYTTGTIDVDFIDFGHGDNDLIATNRQALDWDHPLTQELKNNLQKLVSEIQKDWRKKRKEQAEAKSMPTLNFDRKKWLGTLPDDKAEAIDELLNKKMDDNDQASRKNIEKALYSLAPEHAKLHWRYLHKDVRRNSAAERLYKQNNYHKAAQEAIMQYIKIVKEISKYKPDPKDKNEAEYIMMEKVFKVKKDDGLINLTTKETPTECNIEKGHLEFSRGLVSGFRNPMAHNIEDDLIEKNLISESDCLDILSLISHLSRRIENRKSPKS